jgi:hypothetical protein
MSRPYQQSVQLQQLDGHSKIQVEWLMPLGRQYSKLETERNDILLLIPSVQIEHLLAFVITGS